MQNQKPSTKERLSVERGVERGVEMGVEMESLRLKSTQSISGSNISSPIIIREILQQAADFSETVMTETQAIPNSSHQAVNLGLVDSACWKHANGLVDPTRRLLGHQLKETQESTTAVCETIVRERYHHSSQDCFDKHFAVGENQFLNRTLDVGWVWTIA
jgi:hypothetical protein